MAAKGGTRFESQLPVAVVVVEKKVNGGGQKRYMSVVPRDDRSNDPPLTLMQLTVMNLFRGYGNHLMRFVPKEIMENIPGLTDLYMTN